MGPQNFFGLKRLKGTKINSLNRYYGIFGGMTFYVPVLIITYSALMCQDIAKPSFPLSAHALKMAINSYKWNLKWPYSFKTIMNAFYYLENPHLHHKTIIIAHLYAEI